MADNNHVQNFDSFHNKLLGLGKHSLRKSYYPELQKRIEELENIQVELKKYKDHLEELVVERTNKLNIINEQLQREITERKRAEEGLRKSRRELVDIIEFLPDATGVIDKEGKVIAWNRAMEVMTGVKKEDMIGKGNHEYALPFYGDRRKVLIDSCPSSKQGNGKAI